MLLTCYMIHIWSMRTFYTIIPTGFPLYYFCITKVFCEFDNLLARCWLNLIRRLMIKLEKFLSVNDRLPKVVDTQLLKCRSNVGREVGRRIRHVSRIIHTHPSLHDALVITPFLGERDPNSRS